MNSRPFMPQGSERPGLTKLKLAQTAPRGSVCIKHNINSFQSPDAFLLCAGVSVRFITLHASEGLEVGVARGEGGCTIKPCSESYSPRHHLLPSPPFPPLFRAHQHQTDNMLRIV